MGNQKLYIRIKGWEVKESSNTVNVIYAQWDGQCTCTTLVKEKEVPVEEMVLTSKRTVHESLLKYLTK